MYAQSRSEFSRRFTELGIRGWNARTRHLECLAYLAGRDCAFLLSPAPGDRATDLSAVNPPILPGPGHHRGIDDAHHAGQRDHLRRIHDRRYWPTYSGQHTARRTDG